MDDYLENTYENRRKEIDAFKTVNLTVIASQYGYEIVPKKTNRHSVFMTSDNDKIVIGKNGSHYVYWSVFNEKSSGTAIDFVQNVVEPGCSLPRVREILRPFLNVRFYREATARTKDHVHKSIKSSPQNLLAVAARYAKFETVTNCHPYLSQQRNIPASLFSRPRVEGTVAYCPQRNLAIFPHWGVEEGARTWDRKILTGYEIKGEGVNLFAKSGRKSLWLSQTFADDRTLAVAESGLDALSFLALHDCEKTRAISISGQMNSGQPDLVQLVIEEMEEGATVTAAFDNDEAGDRLTQKLHDIVAAMNRQDIRFTESRPQQRNADWNDVLKQQSAKTLFQYASELP